MRKHSGFTLIEVSIFLAITGLLLGAILVGTNTSINQQRFTDAVQNFADYLRGVYNTVENPQNVTSSSGGRSDRALYGQLITFGESVDFDGNGANGKNLIMAYDVIGDVSGRLDGGDILGVLKTLNLNVVTKVGGKFVANGAHDMYSPKWGNRIQNEDKNDFKGTLLVVRSPMSGAIHTFAMGNTIEINKQILPAADPPENFNPLTASLNNFTKSEVNFCVGGDGMRQNIRITANAHNSSDIIIVPLDGDDNKCNEGA